MYSHDIPLAELKRRSVMYWPPTPRQGQRRVADTWVILAEPEGGAVTAVLDPADV